MWGIGLATKMSQTTIGGMEQFKSGNVGPNHTSPV